MDITTRSNVLPLPRFAFSQGLWLAVPLLLAACDRQVDSDFQGGSMLRMRGKISVPLALDGAGLRPVIAFSMRDGPQHRFTHRVMSVAVTGEFPSGFTLDLLEPPPPAAFGEAWGGEPEPQFALGRLFVVGPDFPSVFTWVRHDARPVTSCDFERCDRSTICEGEPWGDDPSLHLWSDADIPDGRACFSQILECSVQEGSSAYACVEERVDGDLSLHKAGFSQYLQFVYFPEPVAADTMVAVTYNAGNPITAGYHVYLEPELPGSIEIDPNAPLPPATCGDLAAKEALRRYNESHGTAYTHEPELPSESQDPYGQARGDYERSIYRVMREQNCPIMSSYTELGPDDLIEIELAPGMPAPK